MSVRAVHVSDSGWRLPLFGTITPVETPWLIAAARFAHGEESDFLSGVVVNADIGTEGSILRPPSGSDSVDWLRVVPRAERCAWLSFPRNWSIDTFCVALARYSSFAIEQLGFMEASDSEEEETLFGLIDRLTELNFKFTCGVGEANEMRQFYFYLPPQNITLSTLFSLEDGHREESVPVFLKTDALAKLTERFVCGGPEDLWDTDGLRNLPKVDIIRLVGPNRHCAVEVLTMMGCTVLHGSHAYARVKGEVEEPPAPDFTEVKLGVSGFASSAAATVDIRVTDRMSYRDPVLEEYLAALRTEVHAYPPKVIAAVKGEMDVEDLHNYINLSGVKLDDMCRSLHLLDDVWSCLDLGAAPGGWVQCVNDLGRNVEIHVVTLDKPHANKMRDDVGPYRVVEVVGGDVLSDSFLSAELPEVDLLLSDMSPFSTTAGVVTEKEFFPYLKRIAAATRVLKAGGHMVFKFFGAFEPGTRSLLVALGLLFQQCYVFKPRGSRAGSSELYFVGKGKIRSLTGVDEMLVGSVYRWYLPSEWDSAVRVMDEVLDTYTSRQIVALRWQLWRSAGHMKC